MALRERVVAFVEEGHSHRAAAARFRVSVKFVNDMVILKRETGGLEPRAQGNGGGHGKLVIVQDWITGRQPFMRNLLPRIGFIDETSLTTNMAKTTGWRPKGARLIDHAPFGHWNTQTFIAALRHDRLDAP